MMCEHHGVHEYMRVLVTGGAGYIGSHAVRELRARGDVVIVLDTLENGHRAAVGDITFIEGDIANVTLVEQILREHAIEAVIHFAGYKAANESINQPARYFENNVAGSLSLLHAMQTVGISAFVFSSSAAIYGTPQTLPVREEDSAHPESPYAASKLMVEHMLPWFRASSGLRSVVLRYFNVAGASLDTQIGEAAAAPTNLIPITMNVALGKTRALQVFGTDYPTPDGTAIRDYIHVLDLVDAHLKALDYLHHNGDSATFNIGMGKGVSVREVITLAQQLSGVGIPLEYKDRRPGDPVAVWADTTRARDILHWRPHYDLSAMISTAWAWHSTHPHGYAQERT